MSRKNDLLKEKEDLQKEIFTLKAKIAKKEEKIEEIDQKIKRLNKSIINTLAMIVSGETKTRPEKLQKTKGQIQSFLTKNDLFDDDGSITEYYIGNNYVVNYRNRRMGKAIEGITFSIQQLEDCCLIFMILVGDKQVSEKERTSVRDSRAAKNIEYVSDEYDLIANEQIRNRVIIMTRYKSKYSYDDERVVKEFNALKQCGDTFVRNIGDRDASCNLLKKYSRLSTEGDKYDHKLVVQVVRVPIINPDGTETYTKKLTAYYCRTCDCYFVGNHLLEEYRRQNAVMVTIDPDQRDSATTGFGGALEAQSLLNIHGYNVNATTNYTDEQRHRILDIIISNRIMARDRIIDYLRYFIDRSRNQPNMSLAREKWGKDLMYLHSKR